MGKNFQERNLKSFAHCFWNWIILQRKIKIVFFNAKRYENHEGFFIFGKTWSFRFAWFFFAKLFWVEWYTQKSQNSITRHFESKKVAALKCPKKHPIALYRRLGRSLFFGHRLPKNAIAKNTTFDAFRVGYRWLKLKLFFMKYIFYWYTILWCIWQWHSL